MMQYTNGTSDHYCKRFVNNKKFVDFMKKNKTNFIRTVIKGRLSFGTTEINDFKNTQGLNDQRFQIPK